MSRTRTVNRDSETKTRPVSEVVRSAARAIERRPRETAVIQSFVEEKMKGAAVPKGENKQAALAARKYESVLSSVRKSSECRDAAKKIAREFEGGLGIRSGPGSEKPQPRELIIGIIIGIIVIAALSGCVKDKPKQTVTTGSGIMQPGTSQNDPVNQGGAADGGTDSGG